LTTFAAADAETLLLMEFLLLKPTLTDLFATLLVVTLTPNPKLSATLAPRLPWLDHAALQLLPTPMLPPLVLTITLLLH